MNIQTLRRPLASVEADRLALGLFEGQSEPPPELRGTALGEILASLIQNKDVPGDVGAILPLHGVSGVAAGTVLLFGLGKREKFGAGPAFEAGVAVARNLAGKKRRNVAVALPDLGDLAAIASALTAGLVVGTQGCGIRKSEPSRFPFDDLTLIIPAGAGDEPTLAEAVRHGAVVGDSVNLARELVNIPSAEKTPTMLAARAFEVANEAKLGVEVWDEERIRAERFGGLLGVSAGSDEPPRFVVLDYRLGGEGPTLALVGKGVTFDSGGLSLKPSTSMEDMKSDMTGAAVVLATMSAAARLKLPVNLRGYLALTENMTGGKALKLGDILTMRNGKTVEVLNTDAEGRLILADALSYAAEAKPDRLIDLATLTCACMVALGTQTAGLFSNHDKLAGEVLLACRKAGERAWRLPLDDDFKELLKSQVADLKNIGGKFGGATSAAKFLEEFVAETPWVHLDIAGPSWADSEDSTRDAGGTGCFVRTLLALIESGLASHPSEKGEPV